MTTFRLPSGCEHLEKSHLVRVVNVISSSSIKSKVDQLLAILVANPSEHTKPAIVVFTAKPKVASKLITVVEIAKRQLAQSGQSYFQYTGLTSQMVEIVRPVVGLRQEQKSELSAAKDVPTEVEEGEELDDSFEMITEFKGKGPGTVSSDQNDHKPAAKTRASTDRPAGGHKTRAVPLLFTYMSTKHIQELKDVYGFVHLYPSLKRLSVLLLIVLLYREQTNV